MKKIFAVLCVIAFTVSGVYAQKVVFPTDEKGRICYTNEFETDQSKAELFESCNLWAVTTFHTGDAVFSKDEAKGEVLANGTVKTKSAYNPFAGWFNEYVTFVVKFNVDDGKIKYTLYRPTLAETYAGYGTNQKTFNMDDKYAAYLKAYEDRERAKNDASMSKKEAKSIIKAANELIADMEESLGKAEEGMRDVAKMIETNLFR